MRASPNTASGLPQRPHDLVPNFNPGGATLSEMCSVHSSEKIKYFCRADQCNIGLCPDCIIEHSKHDFIAAGELAVIEIKNVAK
jgi:hypothetical protein